MSQDTEQLRLLSIFHYVLGGIAALFALVPIIHLTIGLALLNSPQTFDGKQPPPPIIGWIFVIAGAFAILLGLTFAILTLFTGRFLAIRRHYMYCFVMACVECLFMPFGTVLGIISLIVLTRESVKALFAGSDG